MNAPTPQIPVEIRLVYCLKMLARRQRRTRQQLVSENITVPIATADDRAAHSVARSRIGPSPLEFRRYRGRVYRLLSDAFGNALNVDTLGQADAKDLAVLAGRLPRSPDQPFMTEIPQEPAGQRLTDIPSLDAALAGRPRWIDTGEREAAIIRAHRTATSLLVVNDSVYAASLPPMIAVALDHASNSIRLEIIDRWPVAYCRLRPAIFLPMSDPQGARILAAAAAQHFGNDRAPLPIIDRIEQSMGNIETCDADALDFDWRTPLLLALHDLGRHSEIEGPPRTQLGWHALMANLSTLPGFGPEPDRLELGVDADTVLAVFLALDLTALGGRVAALQGLQALLALFQQENSKHYDAQPNPWQQIAAGPRVLSEPELNRWRRAWIFTKEVSDGTARTGRPPPLDQLRLETVRFLLRDMSELTEDSLRLTLAQESVELFLLGEADSLEVSDLDNDEIAFSDLRL